MKTIPFNLERALAGVPVITQDGKPARLICSDARHTARGREYPVIVLIEAAGNDKPYFYSTEGVSAFNKNQCLLHPVAPAEVQNGS